MKNITINFWTDKPELINEYFFKFASDPNIKFKRVEMCKFESEELLLKRIFKKWYQFWK